MKTITLARGEQAIVDDEDYEMLSKYCWSMNKAGYAVGSVPTGKRGAKHVLMHRLVVSVTKDQFVDHKDGNRLNNVRENLRIATRSQNGRNCIGHPCNRRSQYKGVNWDKRANRWRVKIKADGKPKPVYIGVFQDEREAAIAYDLAAKKYHGEWACLNFPDEELNVDGLRCLLCNRDQGIITLKAIYEHQRFRVCVACLKYALENARPGDTVSRSPKAQYVPAVKPIIAKES